MKVAPKSSPRGATKKAQERTVELRTTHGLTPTLLEYYFEVDEEDAGGQLPSNENLPADLASIEASFVAGKSIVPSKASSANAAAAPKNISGTRLHFSDEPLNKSNPPPSSMTTAMKKKTPPSDGGATTASTAEPAWRTENPRTKAKVWRFYLRSGFSLCVTGCGSKYQLLRNFANRLRPRWITRTLARRP